MPTSTTRPLLTIEDYRTESAMKLKKMTRDYYEAGSDDQLTLNRNENAFKRFLIRPRCLRDVSSVDTSVEWYGRKHSFPIGLAPSAFHRMATRDGELSTVKGASMAGAVMICSSWSTTAIEEVAMQAQEQGVEIWFQVMTSFTFTRTRQITSGLISRAEACGCKALVLTVDAPVLGRRLADLRNAFTLPDGLRFANFSSLQASVMPSTKAGSSGFMEYVSNEIDPSINWDTIDWLLKSTKLPIIIKGVMRGDDAEEAVRRGVHGIIVSNHGGRQMDSAPATVSQSVTFTIEVLSEVVHAVQGRVPVFIDGGFRNGRDVFKAIALGAKGVFIGRPVLCRSLITVKGAEGVAKSDQIAADGIAHTMQLAGCHSVEEIQESPDIVVHQRYYYAKL
ncbi:dehydrogenase, FMN-dependent [Ostertagia ostertagi]